LNGVKIERGKQKGAKIVSHPSTIFLSYPRAMGSPKLHRAGGAGRVHRDHRGQEGTGVGEGNKEPLLGLAGSAVGKPFFHPHPDECGHSKALAIRNFF
jgi:hypothetical protein